MDKFDLDAIVSLTGSPSWTTDLVNGDHFLTASSTPAAVAGFLNVTVPAGFVFDELPVGISFIGRQWAEPTLIRLAHGFEQGTRARHAPKFVASLAVRDFIPRHTGVRGGSASAQGRQRADLKAQPARRNPVAGSL
jgi:amidase